MFGLVVSPGYPISQAEVHQLRPAYLRTILYQIRDTDKVSNLGVPYIATINNECAEVRGWANWEEAIELLANRPQLPWAVEIGNEFDLYWQHNPNDVPPSFAADLIKRAAPILHSKGIQVIATSVASAKWPQYLEELANLCRNDVEYFNIHPYGQRPEGWGSPGWMHGELKQTLLHAHALAQRSLYCTEIGVKIGDAGGEDQVGWWMKAAAQTMLDLGPNIVMGASWFASEDAVGAPHERGSQAFGLRRDDADRSRRPAWYAFQELPQRRWENMPVFTVGQGVKDLMAQRGDQPATDEIYHPIGAPAGKHQYSETFGTSGTRYVYIFSTNQVKIYNPGA